MSISAAAVCIREKLFVVGFLAMVAGCASLRAQSGAGSIQGTVVDASSAAVPACAVHIINQATNVSNDATTNATGFYSVQGLFAGNYTVTFTAPGMKKYQATIALQDAQVAVLNPKLTLGDVTEQVTVSGETIQLATYDSGTVSTQLDSNRIDQLPQNGRNVLGFAQNTVPGLEAGGTRANGLMGEAMEYSQDGAPMTNRNFGGESNVAQAILPDPDAVQEAKFETLNSSAQFATPATVILTTKSGTNYFHGSSVRNRAQQLFRGRQGAAKSRQLCGAAPGAERIRAPVSAVRSSIPKATTARTRRSSSSLTSASLCARPPTNW